LEKPNSVFFFSKKRKRKKKGNPRTSLAAAKGMALVGYTWKKFKKYIERTDLPAWLSAGRSDCQLKKKT
jgi:hypothetical protein